MEKIAVALSGGIDSTLSAYLLKQQGYQVIGITLYLFEEQKTFFQELSFIINNFLKIPHYFIDLRDIFRKKIINQFIKAYQEGETPNPCAWCNREIKFGFLFHYVQEQFNCQYLATGHYTQIGFYKGHQVLSKSKESKKDQTYFLALIKKEILSHLMFPLGKFTKKEVYKLAQKLNLSFKKESESQDICFLKGISLKDFLKKHLPCKEGPIIYQNRVVGKHPGIQFFTLGQRKGLNLALGKPVYIIKIDPIENKIFVGKREELYTDRLTLKDLNLHLPLELWEKPTAQVRYRSEAVPVKEIKKRKKGYEVFFEKPVWGVTPGQVCVFYENNHLLGGGIITK